MPAQTFQTSRDWIRRNVDDEKDGSAICLTFPPYAKYMIPKIKSEPWSNTQFFQCHSPMRGRIRS